MPSQPSADDAARALGAGHLASIVAVLDRRSVDRKEAEGRIEKAFVDTGHRRSQEETELTDRIYAVFKVLADPQGQRAFWQTMRDESAELDRDRVILNLWKILEDTHATGIQKLGGLPYHRAWLLDWFLRRYDVRRAREVVAGTTLAVNAHLILVVGVLGWLLVRRYLPAIPWVLPPWSAAMWMTVAYAVAVCVPATASSRRLTGPLEASVLALQSFLPRIAGACAVGLLILASSAELLTLVSRHLAGAWSFIPLAIGSLYLLLEMTRRVHPMPGPASLLVRSLDVGITALGHALAMTLAAEPALPLVLPAGERQPFDAGAILSITVFVFLIGLVVNLIWAEQPVTEPL